MERPEKVIVHQRVNSRIILFVTFSVVLFVQGCAHTPDSAMEADPVALLNEVCGNGRAGYSTSSGYIGIVVRSKKVSGTFSGAVKVDPQKMDLEVTNPLGGTEAAIHAEDRVVTVLVPGKEKKIYPDAYSWNGVPIHFAPEMFLGRFPCPAVFGKSREAIGFADQGREKIQSRYGIKFRQAEPGELAIEAPDPSGKNQEVYRYQFDVQDGKYLAIAMAWEVQNSPKGLVRFELLEKDPETHESKGWKVVSNEGEVKLLWKSRRSER